MDQMLEVQQKKDGKIPSLSLAVFGIACVVLSRIPIGNVLFVLPLLLVSTKVGKNRTLVLFSAVIVCIAAWALWDCFDRTSGTVYIGLFIFSAFVPVTLGLSCGIWAFLGYENRLGMKKRFLISALVCSLLSALFLVWLSLGGEGVQEIKDQLGATYTIVFGESYGASAEQFLDIALTAFSYALVPIAVTLLGFILVLSSSMEHKFDQEWQYRVGTWSIPNDFVWVFLLSFFGAILSGVFSLPSVLNVVLWNLALLSAVAYGIQGFAILVFLIRKKINALVAHKFAVMLGFSMVIPGVNMAVLVGLPLLGVLETWIVFRKPNKENSYEDHFESGRT